jgi:predicted 2-oxoglutarate/Fe(II)-dependent dioxygenase YbiX
MAIEQREPMTAAEMTALGGRLLIGRDAPVDPTSGLDLLRRALDAGDGEAAALMAVLHGAGAWVPQSWETALDLLAAGARLGSRRAGGQLKLLAGATRGDETRGEDWAALRRRIDLSPWLTTPTRRAVWDAPRVRMSEGFAPPEVGAWIIDQVRGRMRQALMYHGDVKREVVDPHRSCSDFEYDLIGSDLILILIRNRIAAVTGLPVAAMEPPRVFHYALGQDIKPHYDRLNDGIGDYARSGYKGDRIATFLLYLNDDFDGGELEFPLVGQRFKGKAGDALYFAHVDQAGGRERLSLHAGLPILRGEKYVLSQWIHDRPLVM